MDLKVRRCCRIGLSPVECSGEKLTSVGLPELLHAMPHEHDAWELRERLYDVEVTEGTHFEKRHAVFFRVRPCLFCGDLSLESQVQPVTHKDTGHTRCMLRKDKETRKCVTKGGWGGPERYTVMSDWVNLKQCHSWPVSFIYSIRPVISVPSSSPQRKEQSQGAVRGSRKWIQIKPQSSLKSNYFESESSLERCSKKMRVKTK